jgi:hypothetical protein
LTPIAIRAVPKPLGLAVGASAARTVGLLVGVCLDFLLVVVAARNGGRRLVANVVAIEAARATGTANTSPTPVVESPSLGREKGMRRADRTCSPAKAASLNLSLIEARPGHIANCGA